ncbi:MAG: zinc ribbon domain-containing protein [Alphaproteobacteria bacterium]|nr:zinc ribbon domain-containing protein [Alphaproteobacteria bacterium]
MPIYEYRCPDCGHEFEQMRSMSAPPLTECPQCAQNNVRKLISRTSFQLKGGGWYSDHYGLKGGSSTSSDSSSSASSAPSTPSTPSSSADSGGGAATPSAPSAPSSSGTDS